MPHLYQGPYYPKLKDQYKLSCLLQQPSHLYLPKFGPGENRNDMPESNPRYTSPITSSNARRIYTKLIRVIAYYLERPRR